MSKPYSQATYGFKIVNLQLSELIPEESRVYAVIAWGFDCSRGYPLTTDPEIKQYLEANPTAYLDWFLADYGCTFFSEKENDYLQAETWVIARKPDTPHGYAKADVSSLSAYWGSVLKNVAEEFMQESPAVLRKQFTGFVYR